MRSLKPRLFFAYVVSTGFVLMSGASFADENLQQYLVGLDTVKAEIEAGDVSDVARFIDQHYHDPSGLVGEPSNLIDFILGAPQSDGDFLPNPDAIAQAVQTAFFKDVHNIGFLIERVRLHLATFDSLNRFVDDLDVSRDFYISLIQQIAVQSAGAGMSEEFSSKFVFTTCDPLDYGSGNVEALQPEFVQMLLERMSQQRRTEILYYVAAKALSADCVREIFSPR